MKTRYFCTYFDKNYLYRGLALYCSMEKNCGDFLLHILCMDEETKVVLEKLNLPKVNLITLKEFEDPELLSVKSSRTPVEYYWTCTPSLPLFLLKKYEYEMVTYLDADLMFFNSPEKIFEEFGTNSILVIEHRFKDKKEEREAENGKYNVQFLTFRNDENGIACLKWWREKCLEWCFNRHENGLIGDQAYLNDWDKLFKNVHSLENIGGGLAPWNIDNYELSKKKDGVFVESEQLIFYHYHSFKMFSYFFNDPAFGYKFNSTQRKLIYDPYIRAIKQAIKAVKKVDSKFKYGFQSGIWRYLVGLVIQRLFR